jgi:hypothetical protein
MERDSKGRLTGEWVAFANKDARIITSPWAPTPRMRRPSGIDAKHVRLSFPTSGSSRGPLTTGCAIVPLRVDTVEKLDFLPRSQFLRRQAGFKKKALRGPAERLTFRCATPVANW